MLKYSFALILLTLCNHAIAQKQAATWFLGNGNGITFKNLQFEVLTDAPTGYHPYSTISDLDGNLILYTDGKTLWNADNNIIENGTGLTGALFTSIILQKPQSDSQYYIFQHEPAPDIHFSKVVYTLVDMSAKDGQGTVVEKNIELYSNLHGSFTVSGDCDSGYWLVGETNTNTTHSIGTDLIYAFRISESGVDHNPVISSPVSIGASGGYRFSPDGSKLFFGYGGNGTDGTVVADFNTNTGEVTNMKVVAPCCSSGEFSSDGNYLYIPGDQTLRQYDLTKPEYPLITIAENVAVTILQLAPDGKIYFTTNYEDQTGVIHNPNQEGLAAQVEIGEVFPFPISILPVFANNLLYASDQKPDAGSDIEVCSEESVRIGGANLINQNYEWFPKEHLDNPFIANPIFTYSNPSDSAVTFTYKLTNCEADQVKITVFPKPQPAITGSYSVCPGVEFVDYWTADHDGYQYEWIVEGGELENGQGTSHIQITWGPTNPNAKVKLIATNFYNCKSELIVYNVRINVELDTQQPVGPEIICLNKRQNNLYQILPTNGSVYTWEVEGGSITGGQGTHRVQVDWDGVGAHWIRVQEESITIDTICFGVSNELAVLVYQDSLALQIDYVTTELSDDSKISLQGSVLKNGAMSPFGVSIFRDQNNENIWQQVFREEFIGDLYFSEAERPTHENFYRYYLESVNACGESIHSNTHQTILLQTEDDPPALSWNPYQGWDSGVDHYELYRKLDNENEFRRVATTQDLHFTIPDIDSGFVHAFRVKAIAKGNNHSSWSNITVAEFEHPLYIPNIITPNKDGKNDTFLMRNLHLYYENELTIYNRWGKEILNTKNYKGDWDGDGAENGVYYYRFFTYHDSTEYKGWIQLKY